MVFIDGTVVIAFGMQTRRMYVGHTSLEASVLNKQDVLTVGKQNDETGRQSTTETERWQIPKREW